MSQEYSAKLKKSNQHNCPSCGAPMSYSPETGTLYCEHCQGTVDIKRDTNVRERAFTEMKVSAMWKDSDVTSYRCDNCGAKTVLSSTTISTECPYCGASVLVDNSSLDTVRPDTIIPFEVGKDMAENALYKWRRKRLLAPTQYRKHTDVDLIKGTYLPIWTFDAYTQSPYSGRLGRRRTRTVRRGKQTVTETYIQWFTVSGVADRMFDDIFVRGNTNVEGKWLAKLQPFSQEKYVVYNDQYMSGFIADNYTVPPEEAFEQAKAKMLNAIRQQIVAQYNADVVGDLNIQLNFVSQSFKYLMIPVYITATNYKGKLYNNYVSGVVAGKDNKQQPIVKVAGKSPLSPLKVSAVALAILIAVLLAIFLIVPFVNDMPVLEYWQSVFGSIESVNPTYNAYNLYSCSSQTIDNLAHIAL